MAGISPCKDSRPLPIPARVLGSLVLPTAGGAWVEEGCASALATPSPERSRGVGRG